MAALPVQGGNGSTRPSDVVELDEIRTDTGSERVKGRVGVG